MTQHFRTRGALAAGMALLVGACAQGLTDVNENPNAPKDVSADFLLPQAIRTAVENTYARMMLAHTSIWSQHTVQLQYADEERGLVRPQTVQAFWDSLYASALNDVQAVIDKGRAATLPNVEAVGLIWKAWTFQQITDLWGDVPYSEALRARDGITTPVYDAQQAIYAGMFQTLKDAAALLNASAPGVTTGDILYGGDVARWRRFANSLRMRLAMRLSEVAPGTAQTEFVAALAAGGLESNADNAMLAWPGAPYQNPLYENWQGRDDDGISATMVDTLASLQDPRLALYAEPHAYPRPDSSDGRYVGWVNNREKPDSARNYYSRIGNFWRRDGAATPTALMTYSEVLFLRAEAAARGWTAEDAGALYRDAIRANMNQYDEFKPANAPVDSAIARYVAQDSAAHPVPGLIEIHLQKWISLYMQGHEAWADQRRTDEPKLVAGKDLTVSRIPVRFFYPAGEQSLNAANMMAAVQRQMPQGDARTLVGRVWWDVK